MRVSQGSPSVTTSSPQPASNDAGSAIDNSSNIIKKVGYTALGVFATAAVGYCAYHKEHVRKTDLDPLASISLPVRFMFSLAAGFITLLALSAFLKRDERHSEFDMADASERPAVPNVNANEDNPIIACNLPQHTHADKTLPDDEAKVIAGNEGQAELAPFPPRSDSFYARVTPEYLEDPSRVANSESGPQGIVSSEQLPQPMLLKTVTARMMIIINM